MGKQMMKNVIFKNVISYLSTNSIKKSIVNNNKKASYFPSINEIINNFHKSILKYNLEDIKGQC
jgi:DNA-directed RNA polymerase delta subunit